MPSDLARAQIEAQRRLRHATAAGVARAWRTLPGYDRANVPEFLRRVVPLVLASQHRSSSLTGSYLARAMERRPLPFHAAEVIGASVRAGASPHEVYTRPFVTVWTALGEGREWSDAVAAGEARASSSAAMDVQLAMRATSDLVGRADPRIERFRRVADDGACEFCEAVDGAVVGAGFDMALHNGCGCGLEPDTEASPITPHPDSVAVHEHGELGAVLASPDDHFTGPAAVR